MSWARASICRHGLTVPQYACLELLDQHPGLSNVELARGAFVTRQSMNVVLRGLQHSGLVSRPLQPPHGRALPASLTAAGQHRLAAARAVVVAIEQRMTGALPPQRAARLLADLGRMAQALEPPQHDLRGRISSNPPPMVTAPARCAPKPANGRTVNTKSQLKAMKRPSPRSQRINAESRRLAAGRLSQRSVPDRTSGGGRWGDVMLHRDADEGAGCEPGGDGGDEGGAGW